MDQQHQRTTQSQNIVMYSGAAIAARQMLACVFFGFGLMVIGTILTAASTAFELNDRNFNTPRIIGIGLLSVGGAIMLIGISAICIAKGSVDRDRENQTNVGSFPVYPPVLAGCSQTSLPNGQYQVNHPTWNPPPPQASLQHPTWNPPPPQASLHHPGHQVSPPPPYYTPNTATLTDPSMPFHQQNFPSTVPPVDYTTSN